VTGAGALLGFGAHLANVLPDVADDAATGVHGLPHRLGRAPTTALAAAALLGTTVLAVVGPPGEPPAWAWLALVGAGALAGAGAVVAHRAPRSRFPFTATIAVAVLDVGLLVLAAAHLTDSHLV
jgi:4-hydroxybenzoate polyprenyltransferase